MESDFTTAFALHPGEIESNPRALRWATWNSALMLLIAVFAIRLAYQIWFSPYELVGDEAYYWEQARHLDWCYNEKGPALPAMIAVCRSLFGDSEWVVRLPVAFSSLVAGWGIGRLAMSSAEGDERVGFLAVLCFCLIPAFQANAQICTQDGPLIGIWVALTAIGLRIFRRWRSGENVWFDWMLFWFVLGVGFLFKQSILLFLPSLALYWLVERQSLKLSAPWFIQQLAGVCLFAAMISPMVIWNYHHGWPMLEHTLGHLGAGGDQTGLVNKGNPLKWLSSTVGGILGAFGPAFIILALWATRNIWKQRERDSHQWRAQFWMLCAAWPSAIFFILLSLIKPVVASWPDPSLVPLVVVAAALAVAELPRYSALVRSWRERKARPDEIVRVKKPDTFFHQLWVTTVVYGLVGWLVLSFPTLLVHIPVAGPRIQHSVLKRFTGHRAFAGELAAVLDKVQTADGRPPIVVTRYYMDAALDAFYLPNHPVATTYGKYVGKRSTTFDQWPDTSLDNPANFGRSLLLVEQPGEQWEDAFLYGSREPLDLEHRFWLVTNYRGPKTNQAEPKP